MIFSCRFARIDVGLYCVVLIDVLFVFGFCAWVMLLWVAYLGLSFVDL